jgi:hypothetical protein
MVQTRLIGAVLLVAAFAGLFGAARPREIILSSLLDDLTTGEVDGPKGSLKSLSSAEHDFRACDPDWNRVNDFWTADIKDLYTLKPLEADDSRANDRDWCHVNDFWTENVAGLYTLVSAAVTESTDSAITLIELSVASADAEEGDPLPSDFWEIWGARD